MYAGPSRHVLLSWSRLSLPSLLLASYFLVSACSSAQTAASPAPPDFSAEPFVIRQLKIVYICNPDGTGSRDQTLTVAIQSEAALRSFSVLGAPFASASEHAVFEYARVRHPDGAVVETSPTTAFEQPEQVTKEAPLYSDLKQLQLPVRGLRVGDIVEWQIHVDRVKAEAPGNFWGRQDLLAGAVVLATDIELRIPSNHPATVWTNPANKLQPTITTEGALRIYRWHSTALSPTVGSQAEAAKKTKEKAVLTPVEQLDATEGKLPDMAWTSFPDWNSVGAWYRSLEGARTRPGSAITAKVNELTVGKSTLEAKTQAVYNYVSSQIHYVGVDLGVGRYQPHPATEVLDNQYGDCKDKHTLLAAMLTVLGLHPDAVLIGSGIRFNPAVPSPDNFNHLITHLKIGDQDTWLDSTQEVAPYRMLFATLRDKRALVVPAEGQSDVEQTPADPPFPTFEKMNASGSLDAIGTAESHFTLEQRGDEELLIRAVLRQITPVQYDEFTQRLVASFGFSGTVSHARFEHVEDPSQPLTMEWDYHREKPGDDWGNLRITPQLLMTLLPLVNEKEPPTQDIQLAGARDITSTATLKLPEGWTAELPEAVHSTSAFGTYDLTFRYDKGIVYAERHWTVRKKAVRQTDWKLYEEWTTNLSLGNEPYVQLHPASAEKAEAHTQPSSTLSVAPAMEKASKSYIAQAYSAIQAGRLDDGAAFLDKAKALEPQQQNLWGDYGWLAWKRGNHPEAMRLYRKELDSYPDSNWAYASLSQLEVLTGDRDGAIKTMHRYVDHSPDSPDAATAQIGLLLSLERTVDAAAAADAALARLPESVRTNSKFQLAVTKAELRGGKQEIGIQTAELLVGSTTDPLILNDTAYELSVASQRLPLAESTERKVIDQLTAETQTWTLDEGTSVLRSRSELLTAAWDTMGWILYRQGKFEEAEPYIRACWLNRPNAEVGEHLGDVQRARGETSGALHTYALALASVPQYTPMGVRKTEKSEKELELDSRIKGLHGNAEIPGPTALQELRTIPLPAALGHDGVVQYKLLLSSAGIQRAVPATSNELTGGADLLRKAKLPAALFPPGSEARLVRLGTLNCHSGTCELVLAP